MSVCCLALTCKAHNAPILSCFVYSFMSAVQTLRHSAASPFITTSRASIFDGSMRHSTNEINMIYDRPCRHSASKCLLALCGIRCCPVSVRPSVTRRYCNKTDKRRITKTTSYDNRDTLCAKDIDDIPIGSPPTGAQVQVGYGEKIAFFDRQ